MKGSETMANQDIRRYAKQNGVKLWQVAKVMGVSEPTMTRLLRQELSESKKTEFIRIINELAARNTNE
jgi:predicted XRE-type DNA-binding protein